MECLIPPDSLRDAHQRLRDAAQAVVEAWANEYYFHAGDGCPMCTATQALAAVLRKGEAP